MLQSETEIICPQAKPGADPIIVDLTNIYKIEDRIQEVAFVTPAKAPELLARFNEAYLFLHRHATMLEHELLQAEREANKLKAIILLDRVPAILKEKGLAQSRSPAGSEDLRNAILDLDEEYQTAVARGHEIKCVIELLRGKIKGMEMAFTSVKKILGEGAFNFSKNQNLSGSTGTSAPGTLHKPLDSISKAPTTTSMPTVLGSPPANTSNTQPTTKGNVWGKARYSNQE